MNVFFTSDTHFGHTNIIKYCNRPFKDSHEMDETLISNWNSIVKTGDHVFHLGDVAFGRGVEASYVKTILNRLNGSIFLIKGNHEKLALANHHRFSWIKDYEEIEIEGQRIILFHYGQRTWHHDIRGTWPSVWPLSWRASSLWKVNGCWSRSIKLQASCL